MRKAVDAKRRDILFQFLIESAVLSVSGGVLGILVGLLLGISGAKVISAFLMKDASYLISVSFQSIAVAFLTSVFIGLIFGLYPANRAAKLDPAEALRRL